MRLTVGKLLFHSYGWCHYVSSVMCCIILIIIFLQVIIVTIIKTLSSSSSSSAAAVLSFIFEGIVSQEEAWARKVKALRKIPKFLHWNS